MSNMKRTQYEKVQHGKNTIRKVCNIEIAKHEKSAIREKYNVKRVQHEEMSHEKCETLAKYRDRAKFGKKCRKGVYYSA